MSADSNLPSPFPVLVSCGIAKARKDYGCPKCGTCLACLSAGYEKGCAFCSVKENRVGMWVARAEAAK